MRNLNRRSTPGASSARISRRDFLDGLLIASGGFWVSQSSPMRAVALEPAAGVCGDMAGKDPRILRSGNLPAAFNVGHWMRDRRLTFKREAVTIAPGCDAHAGRFQISDEAEEFDVIVVGAGLAGLSSAFFLLRERPRARILLLEANGYAGGNAARDEGAPLPVRASAAGAFCVLPEAGFMRQLYNEIGIEGERYKIRSPRTAYFFDENTPGVKQGYRGWQTEEIFSPGKIKNPPYNQKIMNDLAKSFEAFKDWANVDGGPDDPPDNSSPRYDYLSQMTLADYLTKELQCDPIVVEFYSNYTSDCMGGGAHSVNAHTAISFLSSEHSGASFAYPGGTSEIAARLAQWLTEPNRSVKIRKDAVALRVDVETSRPKQRASVTYFKDNKFHRATAKAAIVATQASSAKRLIEHLCDAERKAAWDEFNTAPALVANVALRNMQPVVKLGLGYDNYLWGSQHWTNFEIADWTTENRENPARPSVLTFFGGIRRPREEFPAERMELLQTPFDDYEKSLRRDLSRIMHGADFDFDRDVSAIFVYRWGHSMILPTTKSVFGDVRGADGRLDRSKAPRRVACRPLGPISFAGQHTEGSPSIESAIGSGQRAAGELLTHL
jgi:spermidine dehydrogenase